MKTQLSNIFGNCKYHTHCICTVRDSFEEISNSIFYIYDEGGESQRPIRIVGAEDTFQLTVNNYENRYVCVTKTDKCLLNNNISKCDCFIFDDRRFFLVEIKTASNGSRGKRRKEAVEQLKATVEFLKENKVDFEGYQVLALVCFKTMEPKITQASRNSANAVFREAYGIKLEEGNVIDF